MLDFQRHSWSDFHADFRSKMKLHRWALLPIRPIAQRSLVRRGLVHASLRWQGRAQPARIGARSVFESGEPG